MTKFETDIAATAAAYEEGITQDVVGPANLLNTTKVADIIPIVGKSELIDPDFDPFSNDPDTANVSATDRAEKFYHA